MAKTVFEKHGICLDTWYIYRSWHMYVKGNVSGKYTYIAQWTLQKPKLEVPTIYKAACLGLCKGIYLQNMA